MKLKPLGKKLALCQTAAVISLAGLPITFHFGWAVMFCICALVLIVSGSQVISIRIDANFAKYGFFGHIRGTDILRYYEPGDKEYEDGD